MAVTPMIEAPARRSTEVVPAKTHRRSLHRGPLRSGFWELGFVGAGLLVYFLIRGAVVDETLQAMAHAGAIVRFEQRFGFFWEPHLQRLLSGGLLQTQFWNLVYFWGHAPVIAVVAFWLYRRHRPQYSLIRNAFLISALIGLAIYWLYPVAPPRLIAGFGFADTMQRYAALSYQAESLKPFVNPYAAMPSLHVGWTFLIGVGLVRSLPRPLSWIAGVLLPVLMLLAVVATANHFIVDALAGLAVATIGLLVALALERRSQQRQPARFASAVGRA